MKYKEIVFTNKSNVLEITLFTDGSLLIDMDNEFNCTFELSPKQRVELIRWHRKAETALYIGA